MNIEEQEEATGGYKWESGYEKTWEAIQEDESGSLVTAVTDLHNQAKRRNYLLDQRPRNSKLGMMRYVFVVIDMSRSMNDLDLKPSRISKVSRLVEGFCEQFFDQNPISQLGLVGACDKRADILVGLTTNLGELQAQLGKLSGSDCKGEFSLENSLDVAGNVLKTMPQHASREVLLVVGSLSTCDPGDIEQRFDWCSENRLKCSVIGLAASVHCFHTLATRCEGQYHVILDEHHLKHALFLFVAPPPAAAVASGGGASSLVKMGFPEYREDLSQGVVCSCHADNPAYKCVSKGYACPQCAGCYCSVPIECKVCGLNLVSAPHLARSYHHLFPLQLFKDVLLEGDCNCCACLVLLKSSSTGYQCMECSGIFCLDCDIFVHDTIHTCPTCFSRTLNS